MQFHEFFFMNFFFKVIRKDENAMLVAPSPSEAALWGRSDCSGAARPPHVLRLPPEAGAAQTEGAAGAAVPVAHQPVPRRPPQKQQCSS